jgi:alpha-methylacyl-CoA racemase
MASDKTWNLLEGVRIVDISSTIPGPYASLLLADFGADVVKVEAPAGDMMRSYKADGDGPSLPYVAVNGGKRITRLNLKDAADKALFAELVSRADVLLDGFRPGVLARLGLDSEALSRLNPRLIHCSITGYGQTGSRAANPAHDLNIMAMAGGLLGSGTSEEPVQGGLFVSDYASGLHAAALIAAALVRQARTNTGARIDLSMAEVVLGWHAGTLALSHAGHTHPPRGLGPDTGGRANYRLYRTADDRFVALAAEERKFWENFCRAVDRPDWSERFEDHEPQTELMADVAALFARRDGKDWQELLTNADCCFDLLLTEEEVLTEPQFLDRGVLHHHADGARPQLQVGQPAWLDGQPSAARRMPNEVDAATILDGWAETA